jgi:hypothetical protein
MPVQESSLHRSSTSSYYTSLKSDVKVYTNVFSILDKIEADGYLSLLTSSLQFIFQKEISFAVSGKFTRNKQITDVRSVDRPRFPAPHEHPYIQGEPPSDTQLPAWSN